MNANGHRRPRHGRRRKLTLLSAVAATTVMAAARAAAPLFVDATPADNFKIYWLIRAPKPPVIDGRLDDAVWQQADPLTDWGTTNYGRQIKPGIVPGKIDFRAAWDDTYLYVAARCYHPLNPNDMKEFARQVGDLSKAIYARECIEIHIDGNLDHATRFQSIVNALGEKVMLWHYDFGWGLLVNPDYGLDADWDVAGSVEADHWTVEVRYALADIQIKPGVGHMFGINPCWFDWADSKNADGKTYWWQYVTWSTHGDSHHDPRLYGRSIMVDKKPASLEAGLRLAFADLDQRSLMIQTADGFLVFRNGKSQLLTYEAQVKHELQDTQGKLARLHALLDSAKTTNVGHLTKTVIPEQEKALTALAEKLEPGAKTDRSALGGMRKELGEIGKQLEDAYWRVKEDALLTALPPAH